MKKRLQKIDNGHGTIFQFFQELISVNLDPGEYEQGEVKWRTKLVEVPVEYYKTKSFNGTIN